VAAGKLREDLYFRLARPELTLPPLRKRREEVAFLLEQELRKATPGLGLHVSLVEACLLRPWPGNVRELLSEARSAVRAALAQKSELVERAHLSPSAGTAFRVATPNEALPEPSRPSPSSRPTSDELIAAREAPGGLASATSNQASALPPAKAALAPPLYMNQEGGAGPTSARAEGGAADAAQALAVAAGKSPDPTSRRGTPRAKPLELAEKNRIEAALLLTNGKVRVAAKELGLHRTQLRRLIERGQVLTPKPDPDEPPAGREDDAESALGGG
jgi:DNA-binding NtrC family response regulator